MERGKKRLATLVGCNYTNTKYELHGCINDVLGMRRTLVDRFGFDPEDVVVLTDERGSVVMPTGTNIKRSLGAMIGRAEPGDVLFFHYSGHGTTVPAVKPHHGPKRDEAIVPCDFNLITDVDFRKLVNRLPKGSSLTIVSDSCHSGGLIDKEKEQIGPASTPVSLLRRGHRPTTCSGSPKSIPYESVLSHLSSLSRFDSPHVADHLSNLFGPDMTLKYACPDDDDEPIIGPDDGILLSGCQADETSADMRVGDGAYGAFSNALEMVLVEEEEGVVMSNKEVAVRVRDVLHRQGFGQHPCLYCSDDNAEAPFLWRSVIIVEEEEKKRGKKERKEPRQLLQSTI